MKLLLFVTAILMYFVLRYGYYNHVEEGEVDAIFFEKKYVTLQIKFHNIFVNQSEDKKLEDLSLGQRKKVVDYCKYRLGIIAELNTEEDLERCKEGPIPLHFRKTNTDTTCKHIYPEPCDISLL
jgi:hypothetical protein